MLFPTLFVKSPNYNFEVETHDELISFAILQQDEPGYKITLVIQRIVDYIIKIKKLKSVGCKIAICLLPDLTQQ